MSMNKYKGLIRGAFALSISYLEKTTFTPNTRDELEVHIRTYLKDNGLDLDKFQHPKDKSLVKRILRAGERVYFDNKSMDEALEELSQRIHLYL